MSLIPSSKIPVGCPQCGGTQFVESVQADPESNVFECSDCGATYVGGALVDEFVSTDAADAAIEKEASDAIDKLMSKLFR